MDQRSFTFPQFSERNQRPEVSSEQFSAIRDETKELSKTSLHVYNTIILSCQNKCLNFNTNIVSENEQNCLRKCVNENMFLDNMVFEFDSAQVLAEFQEKPKKATFYFARRMNDLTQ